MFCHDWKYRGQCFERKKKKKTKLKQKEFENTFSKERVRESECVPFFNVHNAVLHMDVPGPRVWA